MNDTIAAVATASGEGGIGIVRISGSNAVAVADRIFQTRSRKPVVELTARQATLGVVVYAGVVIDEALLLKFVAPKSYTGEDVVEIQAHGGAIAVKNILLAALGNGARLAEPGEFTKRAFLNGRLDLAQAEAVIDVIRAKTDASLRAANRSLSGKLSAAVRALRGELLALLAHIAVTVDYPEDDIETIVIDKVQLQIEIWLEQLATVLAQARSGRILRDGLRVAIIGRPNAGKSSLLNALLGTERAIVTEIPGTTRDSIEECVNIRGIPIVLTDTAGLRETMDVVERIGVERATVIAEAAELVLYIAEGSEQLHSDDFANMREYKGRLIVVINKTDLTAQSIINKLKLELAGQLVIAASMTNLEGLADIENAVAETVYANCREPEQVMVANVRQLEILARAKNCLQRVAEAIQAGMPCDILSVDLRDAWECLGEITGETVKEDLLERIFSEFCLGK